MSTETPKRRRRAGFTLLEILTAAAIGLVILAAAVAMFNGLTQVSQDADRTLTAANELQLGTSVMMRNLENAGYHFPTSRFAITIRDNVPAGPLSNGQGSMPSMTVANRVPYGATPYTAGQEGIVAGSDVVEVLMGNLKGDVATVSDPGMLSGMTRTIVFNPPPTGNTALSYPTPGPVFLFRDPSAECLGVMTSGGGTTFVFTMLDDAMEPSGAMPMPPCPIAGMNAYPLSDRARYMLYQFPGEISPMLAVQHTVDAGSGTYSDVGSGVLKPVAEPLVESVEDFQIAGVMKNQSVCGGGATCICGDGLDDVTGLPDTSNDCVVGPTNRQYTRGVHAEFTTRGSRGSDGFLVTSYNRDAGMPDGVRRRQFNLAVLALNLSPQVSTGSTDGGP